MSALNPYRNADGWDVLILAGLESPGICKLTVPSRETGWDQQQGKDGAPGESVQNGTKGAEIQCEFYLWEDPANPDLDMFAEWETFRETILKLPVKKAQPKALDIYHPALEGKNITSVVVKSWGNPQPDGLGGGTAKVVFLEYLPSKPKGAGGKPKGSKANEKGDPPDPNADVKAELDEATQEFNEPAKPLW